MAALTPVEALPDETVDALVYRVTGAASPTVEAVLEANPGLVELGFRLPAGTVVMIPTDQPKAATATLVQLWD